MNDRTRLYVIVASLLACLVLGYTGVWYWEAARTRSEIKHFASARAAEGVQLTSSGVQIRGFPFSLEARIRAVSLSGIARLPGTTVTAPLVTARARPWRPNDWLVAAPEGVAFTQPGEGALQASVREARGEVSGARGTDWDIELRAGGLSAQIGAEPIDAASLRLHLHLPAKPTDETGAESAGFDVQLDRLKLPGSLGPLDPVVDRIAFDGSIDGVIPQSRLRDALALWRDQGGTIELRHVAINWQKLSLDGNGTVALDKDMQPQAAFSTTVRGWAAMLDALVAEGAMKASEANFARIGLALLARPGADGGSELKTPITVQKSQLYLEKARVAHMPQITWP